MVKFSLDDIDKALEEMTNNIFPWREKCLTKFSIEVKASDFNDVEIIGLLE
jgi:hypothetical protein